MGEEEVSDEFPHGFSFASDIGPFRHSWRHIVVVLPPGFHVSVDELGGFIEGDPVGDEVTKVFRELSCIGSKLRWEFGGDEASLLLEPNRPGEVHESHHDLHTVILNALSDITVMIESFYIP